jgi:acyl carrier protein
VVHDTDPPRGEVERELAGLWSELLGCDPVQRGDNFFALGGDSLLATRLVERVRRRFDVGVSLRAFFAAATVSELAAAISVVRADEPELVDEGVL